jgi:hypothetical protein
MPLNAVLFNCLPQHTAPDFARFDAIEVHPMQQDVAGDGSTDTEPLHASDLAAGATPALWSVFGHYARTAENDAEELHGLECITDAPTEALAEAIATTFRATVALLAQSVVPELIARMRRVTVAAVNASGAGELIAVELAAADDDDEGEAVRERVRAAGYSEPIVVFEKAGVPPVHTL